MFLLALILLGGCADQANEQSEGDSSIQARRAELNEDLTIAADFGNITSVAVDGRGRIYAGDRLRKQVWRFGPDGSPLPPIGRAGKGPGEFTDVTDVVIARGDSLFVLDVQLQRATVFGIGDSVRLAYTADLQRGSTRANYGILVPSRAGMLVQYTRPYTGDQLREPHTLELAALPLRASNSRDGTSPVLRTRDKEFLITQDPKYGFSVGSLPYGREPILRLGPDDRIYAGWNDSLSVQIYDLAGEQVGGFQHVSSTLPVTKGDLDALLQSYSSDMFGRMARYTMQRGIEEGKIPETKPAYQTFLVDDTGRTWFKILTKEDRILDTGSGMRYVSTAGLQDASKPLSPWWIFDGTGELIAATELPSNIALQTIRGAYAYGIATDSLGVQSIIRYRLPNTL